MLILQMEGGEYADEFVPIYILLEEIDNSKVVHVPVIAYEY
jgi:hypothetical protein